MPLPSLGARVFVFVVLCVLAVAGNSVRLPLFSGIDFVFGGVAAFVAIVWLGPAWALLVALAGGLALWIRTGQPFEALLMMIEFGAVVLLRLAARRLGRPLPTLPGSVALYWLFVGLPLALLLFGLVVGLDWTNTWLLVVKEGLNGILNAALAGFVIILAVVARRQSAGTTFRQMLFNSLLLASLVPSVLLIAAETWRFRTHLEQDYLHQARLLGAVAAAHLPGQLGTGTNEGAVKDPDLRALVESVRTQLMSTGAATAAGWGPSVPLRFEIVDAGAPDGAEEPASGSGTWLAHQRSGFSDEDTYEVALPPALQPTPGQALRLRFDAAPIIQQFEQHVLIALSGLLGLALIGILVAARLSDWLTAPLHRLIQTTRALPDLIAESRSIPEPAPSVVAETRELANAMTRMAGSLRAGFEQIRQERQWQSRQQAMRAFQARLLSRLIDRETNGPTYAEYFCAELEGMIPDCACLVMLRAASGRFEALGRASPGMIDVGVAVSSILNSPEVVTCAEDAIQSGRQRPFALHLPHEGDGHVSGSLFPVSGYPAVLVVLRHRTTRVDPAATSFVHEALALAVSVASVAFDALRLRDQHQLLIDALSQAQTGVLITKRTVDNDDLITYVNSGFEAMTGYRAAEVIGRNCRFMQGDDREQAPLDAVRRALQEGSACSVILRNYRKDGSSFWNSLHISPLRDHHGQVTHYVGLQQDVSESVDTMEQLVLSETQLREAQAIAHVGSWSVDMATGEAQWSDETFRLLGFAPGMVTPGLDSYLSVVEPADRRGVIDSISRLRQGLDAQCRDEHRVFGPDGIHRVLLQQARVQLDAAGEPERVFGTCLDVTEARRTEALLREQEARYRLVVNNIKDLIVRIDPQGRFEFVSPSYCATFGVSEAQVLSEGYAPEVHPDDRALTTEAMRLVLGPPYAQTFEHRTRTQTGWRWFQWSNAALLTPEGEVEGVVGVGREITKRKEAEQALARREAMASELQALATQFLSVTDETASTAIQSVLARVGAFLNVDHCNLFWLDPDQRTVTQTHQWPASSDPGAPGRLSGLSVTRVPMAMARLESGEPLVIESLRSLRGDDWTGERRLLASGRIHALLLVPLRLDERLSGAVGVDMRGRSRTWETGEIQFLQLVANILSTGEQRSRSIAALRQSKARYDALAHQSRTIAWELDLDGRLSYVSRVAESVLGYRAGEIRGTRLSSLIAEQETPGAAARMAQLLKEREPFEDFVAPYRTRTGEVLWLATDGAPLFSEAMELIGYRGTSKDVTESQLALQRLAQSESRLSAVFNNAPIGIALIGRDRRPLMVNRALSKLLGRPSDSLLGMRFDDLSHPDDRRYDVEAFEDLIAGRRVSYRQTRRYLRADGEVIWGDLRVTLLPQRPGVKAIPLAMVENVTELHEALDAQRAAEQQLSEYAGQLESVVDLLNLAQTASQQKRDLLDLVRRTFRGYAAAVGLVDAAQGYRLLDEVIGDAEVPAGAAQGVQPELIAKAAEDPGQPVLLPSKWRDGSVDSGASLVDIGLAHDSRSLDGREERLMLSVKDAPEMRSLSVSQRQLLRLILQRLAALRDQQQLQENLVEARERETIGHLASGISHDFNNLLGVIDANLFFIDGTLGQREDLDEEIGQVIKETRSALGQAKVITSGMLTLSASGSVPLERIDLADAIIELELILRQVLPPEIDLITDLEQGLEALSSRGFLQSALLNLSLNARDAMRERGTLRIATRSLRWDGSVALQVGSLPAMDCVEVSVTDSGSGIPDELLSNIFEPLFSTKARNRGHGLGLFMVREFVARTQAGLAVESKPGVGTRFRILLPARHSGAGAPSLPDEGMQDEAVDRAIEAPMPSPDDAVLEAAPSGWVILLVEDDLRVRESLSRLLSAAGYRVEVAGHGLAAIERLADPAAPTIDLVLSDIAMPEMDGLALYAKLAEEHPKLPMILMTGQEARWEEPLQALGETATVLRKPIDFSDLQTALKRKLAAVPKDAGGGA